MHAQRGLLVLCSRSEDAKVESDVQSALRVEELCHPVLAEPLVRRLLLLIQFQQGVGAQGLGQFGAGRSLPPAETDVELDL